jgi:hypothetical protein
MKNIAVVEGGFLILSSLSTGWGSDPLVVDRDVQIK